MDFGIDALQCQMCGMATNIEHGPLCARSERLRQELVTSLFWEHNLKQNIAEIG